MMIWYGMVTQNTDGGFCVRVVIAFGKVCGGGGGIWKAEEDTLKEAG